MALRRQILALPIAASIVAGAAMAWQSSQPPVYEATSVLAVEAAPATVATAGGRPENIIFLARTYAARAATTPVIADAIKRAKLSLDVEQVRQRAAVEVSSTDATITIATTGPTARSAENLAEAMTSALQRDVRRDQKEFRQAQVGPLRKRMKELERKFDSVAPNSPRRLFYQQEYQRLVTARAEAKLRPLDRLRVLSPPAGASEPVSPQPVRAGALAFLIAAVIGVEAVVAWRMLRRPRAGADAGAAPAPAVDSSAAVAAG